VRRVLRMTRGPFPRPLGSVRRTAVLWATLEQRYSAEISATNADDEQAGC
jgi:hypothetical protein